jgi:hypothetical protein
MNIRFPIFGELRESFAMALGAIAAHKLRSTLTLLGVLVGVFSIIVVMTAMRVMQSNIETQLSSLGNQTFMIRKWPGTYWGISGDLEKYWRRKNITAAQVHRLEDRATLPLNIGMEKVFWSGELQTRYRRSAPGVRVYGRLRFGGRPGHEYLSQQFAIGRTTEDRRYSLHHYRRPRAQRRGAGRRSG